MSALVPALVACVVLWATVMSIATIPWPKLDDHLAGDEELLEFRPYGGAREVWRTKHPSILLCGPAGTGKTRNDLQLALHWMEAYPGCRILFIRRTRASMTETVLATWENKVLGPIGHPMLNGPRRAYRDSYVHPNGSMAILGSFENYERLFSLEIDAVIGFEAIEFTATQWLSLDRALRNGVMPFSTKIAETNPGPRGHHLNQDCTDINPNGRTLRIKSHLADNPAMTADYIDRLSSLPPGPLRDRLYLGLWVGESGLVVNTFGSHNVLRRPADQDDALTVRRHGPDSYLILPYDCLVGDEMTIDGDEYEKAVRVHRWIVAIDWGPAAPSSMQLWAECIVRGVRRAFLVEQHYKPGMRVEEYASVCAVWNRAYGVAKAVCDHDPTMIQYLNDHSLQSDGEPIAVRAVKQWQMGCDLLNWGFARDGDGIPRAFLFDTALQHAPPFELLEEHRPYDLETELQNLMWGEVKEGQRDHEKTDKSPDHAFDAARYAFVEMFGRGRRIVDHTGGKRLFSPGSIGDQFNYEALLMGREA